MRVNIRFNYFALNYLLAYHTYLLSDAFEDRSKERDMSSLYSFILFFLVFQEAQTKAGK